MKPFEKIEAKANESICLVIIHGKIDRIDFLS